MITAKQAREMTKTSADEYIEFIEDKIKAAAERGNKSITIRKEPYCRWLYSRDSSDAQAKEVMFKLEQNGFKLSMYYKEMQFVDMGLVISWDDN